MNRSIDETRREFLLALARGAAFVPPSLLTLRIEARAQGRGAAAAGGRGRGAARAAAVAQQRAAARSAVAGGLSPAASAAPLQPPAGSIGRDVPWDPDQPSAPPPWAAEPPTSTGG